MPVTVTVQSYVRNFLDLKLNPLWGNDLGVLILSSDIGKSVGYLGMQYGCSILPMSLSLVGYPGGPAPGAQQHMQRVPSGPNREGNVA